MKKIMLCVLLFLPFFSFSQKIISDKKEIKELKNENLEYSKILIEVAGFKLNVIVGVSSGGIWHFYDEETTKEKKFVTDMDVFNYLSKTGWEYREELTSSNRNINIYLFKRRDKISGSRSF